MPYYPPQLNSEPENRPPRKGVLLRWIVLCVSILLIAYGGVRLAGYLSDLFSSRRTAQELRETAARAETAVPELRGSTVPEITAQKPAESPVPAYPAAAAFPADESAALPQETAFPAEMLPDVEYPNGYELVPRIRTLRKESEYIVGWLTMDDLDEPVAKKDNDYFLDHDAMGKLNVNGAVFMDQGTNLLTRPYTILLYGHNMKTGAMFGNLRKYKESAWCFRHRFLQFDTLYEEGRYEIFAVSEISLTPGKAKFVSLTALQSSGRETRKEALEALIHASIFEGVAQVTEKDQLLLLITCVGDDDERLVVAAKRI